MKLPLLNIFLGLIVLIVLIEIAFLSLNKNSGFRNCEPVLQQKNIGCKKLGGVKPLHGVDVIVKVKKVENSQNQIIFTGEIPKMWGLIKNDFRFRLGIDGVSKKYKKPTIFLCKTIKANIDGGTNCTITPADEIEPTIKPGAIVGLHFYSEFLPTNVDSYLKNCVDVQKSFIKSIQSTSTNFAFNNSKNSCLPSVGGLYYR